MYCFIFQNSSLKMVLPENVYLMTFEPWKTDEYLIRFEHILEKNDDTELSKPVSFDLKDIFPGNFNFVEVSLAGNQWIEDSKRLRFKQMGLPNSGDEIRFPKLESTSISLEPMQIRTFVMMPNHGIQHLILKNLFVVVIIAILRNFFI